MGFPEEKNSRGRGVSPVMSKPSKKKINTVQLSRERVAAIIRLKAIDKEIEAKSEQPLDYSTAIEWDMFHNVYPDDPAPEW